MPQTTLDRLRPIIAKYSTIDPFSLEPKTTIASLSLDSLDFVEIIMGAEEEFEITIPDEAAERMRTVQDVIEYIGKH
jgi:acyl carrier protein